MFYPSNNWYVVRQNCVGVWQVESQQGCFYVPCPSRHMANNVRVYLMSWLRDSHFYRLNAAALFVHKLIEHKISFDEFYKQLKYINSAAKDEF